MSDPATTSPSNPNIGFIGLGIMGEGMAARLVAQGVAGTAAAPLHVWNRTPAKATALVQRFPDAHIVVADSAKAVVAACGITYSMLSTPQAATQVFEAEGVGVLAGVSATTCVVDCATLAESDMQRMAAAVTAKGGAFLEAPVSGSKGPAANGSLVFLCAGSRSVYDTVATTGLTAMGKASHFLGESVGAGTRAKLVVNALMGTMMAAYGEGLALAQAVGLDASKMIEIVGQAAVSSPMYGLKGPKMVEADHAPNFPLKHAVKDMTLAKQMAETAGAEYAVTAAAEALLVSARDDGELVLADEDFSAVFEKIHKESSSEFSKARMTKK